MSNTIRQIVSGLLAMSIVLGWYGERVFAETLSKKVGVANIAVVTPVGIALDNRENLFVVESTMGRVAVVENSGERIAEIVGFKQPVSIAVDAEARLLYVGDAGTGSVLMFGTDLNSRGQLGIGKGEFVRPVGISVDGNGNVYVADSGRDRVRVYGTNTQFKFEFGQTGSDAGQLRHLVSLAIDKGSDEIVIVDRPIMTGPNGKFEGSRVQFFDATGKYLRGFGQYGKGEGMLAKATGVAPDHNGTLYLCDADLNVVSAFDRTGTYLETIYDETAIMSNPVGVAVGGTSGRVFVSSITGKRVNVYGGHDQHIVDAQSSSGGSLTPSGLIPVSHGAALDFVAIPDPGYHVEAVLVGGVDLGAQQQFSLPIVLADQTVFVQYSKDLHVVLVEGAVGGTVTPSGTVPVLDRAELSITFTPDPGWRVADVQVDGLSLGALEHYLLPSVIANHTIRVSFARLTYTINASAGSGGSISPAGVMTVLQGTDVSYSVLPAFGYRISGLYVDNVPINLVDSYVFSNIEADHDIRVVFARKVLEISASASAGGIITPAGAVNVEFGSNKLFSMIPAQGRHVSEVYVDNIPVGSGQRYEFLAVTEPHSIRAEFTRNRYAITVDWQGNGVVSPAGLVIAEYGDNKTFTFTPSPDHYVAMVLVDGQKSKAGESLALANIDATHSISVIFAAKNDLPVVVAGPDQQVDSGILVLNGGHSLDPDGTIVSYLWEQIDGYPVVLFEPDSAKAWFMVPEEDIDDNSLLFRLTVTDNQGATAEEICLITLADSEQPPVAVAGLDQTVAPGATVILDGSESYDPDGNVVAWSWQQLSGSPVTLMPAGKSLASFIAPADSSGTLAFRLVVTNRQGLRAKDDCLVNITVVQEPPVAVTGVDQIVYAAQTVGLDGSDSFDVDDGIRSYLWKQLSGTPAVSINNYTTAKASFVAPEVLEDDVTVLTFELLATDQAGLMATDTVMVHVYKRQSDDQDHDHRFRYRYYQSLR